MADYIDRQVALDVILPYCSDDDGTCSKSGDDLRNLLDDIENLPSADVEPVVHCRDCIFGHKCVDVTNGIITAIWVECINPDGLHRSVPCGGFCHVGIKRKEENGQ